MKNHLNKTLLKSCSRNQSIQIQIAGFLRITGVASLLFFQQFSSHTKVTLNRLLFVFGEGKSSCVHILQWSRPRGHCQERRWQKVQDGGRVLRGHIHRFYD